MRGTPVDARAFDKQFTCDCSGTKFVGENCESEPDEDKDVMGAAIAAILAVLVVVLGIAYAVQKYRVHQVRNSPADFFSELQNLKDQGLVDPALIGEDKVPRELKRYAPFTSPPLFGQWGKKSILCT